MKLTPNFLARLVGGTVVGDGEIELTGFAKIEEAGKGDISFITNPKYARYASVTKASALLVGEDFNIGEDISATLIKVKDPYTTLAMLMKEFCQVEEGPGGIEEPVFISEGVDIPENAYIGAFSYIGKGVKIGENVKIYPNCYIGANCEIGDNTIIYPHVTIYHGCIVGKRSILQAGCVIGSDGFGFAPTKEKYEKIPQLGNVVIEDDVEIGANTTIDRATMGSTVIARGTKLDNLIQVAHNVRIGEHNVFAAQTGIAGSTRIGDWNRIGGQVGFAGHINFGSNCEVGAQSGIHKGLGDGVRVIGYPAVGISDFAKLQVYLKKLPELYEDIKKIKNKE